MIVNHGSSLSIEYFKSYIKLVMNTRECSLTKAKDLAFIHFFEENEQRFGETTYGKFLTAYRELKDEGNE